MVIMVHNLAFLAQIMKKGMNNAIAKFGLQLWMETLKELNSWEIFT